MLEQGVYLIAVGIKMVTDDVVNIGGEGQTVACDCTHDAGYLILDLLGYIDGHPLSMMCRLRKVSS